MRNIALPTLLTLQALGAGATHAVLTAGPEFRAWLDRAESLERAMAETEARIAACAVRAAATNPDKE